MSIASEITRISGLRDTIRTKLVNLGIITDKTANLSACSTAINNLSKVTPSTPATTVNVTPTISNPTTAGVVTVSGSATASVKPTNSKGYTDGSSSAGTITAKTSGTKTITTQAAQTITPGTSNKTIAAGRWLTGTQTIKGDSNLVAANIKNGVSIFGVKGTLAGYTIKTATVTGSQIVKLYSQTKSDDDGDYDYYFPYAPINVSGITPKYAVVYLETLSTSSNSGFFTSVVLNGTYVTAGYKSLTSSSGVLISGTTLPMQGTNLLIPIGYGDYDYDYFPNVYNPTLRIYLIGV